MITKAQLTEAQNDWVQCGRGNMSKGFFITKHYIVIGDLLSLIIETEYILIKKEVTDDMIYAFNDALKERFTQDNSRTYTTEDSMCQYGYNNCIEDLLEFLQQYNKSNNITEDSLK